MAKVEENGERKNLELTKYYDLVIATIDYYLASSHMKIKTGDFDSDEHYKLLKIQAKEHYDKGRLTKLKQWFKDLTEMLVETRDLNFNKYLQEKTKYSINIFDDYSERIEKIIIKGEITNDNQFYDVNSLVDQLSQSKETDKERITILNKLLAFYKSKNNNTI